MTVRKKDTRDRIVNPVTGRMVFATGVRGKRIRKQMKQKKPRDTIGKSSTPKAQKRSATPRSTCSAGKCKKAINCVSAAERMKGPVDRSAEIHNLFNFNELHVQGVLLHKAIGSSQRLLLVISKWR